MDIAISHSAFLRQRLAVRTAGWLSGPRLLLNGTPLAKKKGVYLARADDGADIPIRIKIVLGDPIPVLTVGGETVRVARPLNWYEYVWAAIPLVLLFVGGALGAFVGMLTTYTNFRILRAERGTATRYGLSGIATVGSFFVFFVLVVALQVLFGGSGR
jgi:hypothetical protein